MKKTLAALALAGATLVPVAAFASPVTYDFVWSGASGYSMKGDFTFDTASAADGFIRDGEVTSLFFQGFLNGVSIGSSSNANKLAGFNFNFDAATGQFVLNGLSTSDAGQLWNYQGSGLGFGAGSASSELSLNGAGLGNVGDPVPLKATLEQGTVPEPGSLPLVAIALLAAGLGVRRHSK